MNRILHGAEAPMMRCVSFIAVGLLAACGSSNGGSDAGSNAAGGSTTPVGSGGGSESTTGEGGTTGASVGGAMSTGGNAVETGGTTGLGGMTGTGGGIGTGGIHGTGGITMGLGGMMMGTGGMMMGSGGLHGTGGMMMGTGGSSAHDAGAACHAPGTLQVVNSGMTAYVIDGVANPTLTFCRGSTYVFAVNAPGHPFYIKTVQGTGTGNAYGTGVTGNGVTAGDLTFSVPSAAPDTLFYACSLHAAMSGTIHIVN